MSETNAALVTRVGNCILWHCINIYLVSPFQTGFFQIDIWKKYFGTHHYSMPCVDTSYRKGEHCFFHVTPSSLGSCLQPDILCFTNCRLLRLWVGAWSSPWFKVPGLGVFHSQHQNGVLVCRTCAFRGMKSLQTFLWRLIRNDTWPRVSPRSSEDFLGHGFRTGHFCIPGVGMCLQTWAELGWIPQYLGYAVHCQSHMFWKTGTVGYNPGNPHLNPGTVGDTNFVTIRWPTLGIRPPENIDFIMYQKPIYRTPPAKTISSGWWVWLIWHSVFLTLLVVCGLPAHWWHSVLYPKTIYFIRMTPHYAQ